MGARAEDEAQAGEAGLARSVLVGGQGTCRVVLITGFESFNVALYEKVRRALHHAHHPHALIVATHMTTL